MKNLLNVAVACALAFSIISCGGGGSSTPPPPPPPPPVPLVICASTGTTTACPTAQNVTIGSTQQFAATLNGASATVNWAINGVAGGSAATGTITTGGLYTAPTPFPSPNAFTVTATLQSDATKTANLPLIVVYPNNTTLLQTAPVQMGTTGGNATDLVTDPVAKTTTCCSGTLGALITRGGVTYVLSNNHVLAKSDNGTANATTGDNITQPGLVDNKCSPGINVIAHLEEFAPLSVTHTGTAAAPKNVDAALGQVVAGTVDTTGAILDLGAAGPTSIAAAPPSATLATPALSLNVAKVGRSTGLTCGSISSIALNVQVQYSASCGGTTAFTATYSNQIFIPGNFSGSGDSGSLVVTTAQARPVGLLFAGTTTPAGTVANPIQDVIAAFSTATLTPTIVGGPDHATAVSCLPTATVNSATLEAGAANLSVTERDRATGIKARYAEQFMQNPVITGVEVGASADNPLEAALVLHLSAAPTQPIPVAVEGLRTRVILPATVAQQAHLSVADVESTIAVKEVQAGSWMSHPGIQGIGVAASDDNPFNPAVVIFTVMGEQHPPIPATLNGIRTKVIDSDRFRAYGWGKETVEPPSCSSKPAAPAPKLSLHRSL